MYELPTDTPTCPCCSQADRVIKVSTLVNSEPLDPQIKVVSGKQRPQLRQRLACLPMPVLQRVWRFSFFFLLFTLLLAYGGIIGMFAFLPSYGIGSFVPPWELRALLVLAVLAGGIFTISMVLQAMHGQQTRWRAEFAIAIVEWRQVQTNWQAFLTQGETW